MQETNPNHKHVLTLQQIFHYPAPGDLQWRDVVALIKHKGTAREEDNGRLTFTLGGISEVFHRSLEENILDAQQAMDIRHFLERAGIEEGKTSAALEPDNVQDGLMEKEQHTHDQQNRIAEQQLKTQQREQNERSAFQGGNAQEHQQGDRHK